MYAATAFIILEVVSIITPALSLPSWTLTLVVVLLAIGFPVAAIFSWIFDITPEGLIKTKPTKDEANKGISQKPISRIFNLNNMVVAILLIVICILLYPKIFKQNTLEDDREIMETSIAKQVAQSLNIKLSSAEIKSLRESTTINGEAFKLFLQAKAEITKLTAEGFKNTRGFLETALELDPNYA